VNGKARTARAIGRVETGDYASGQAPARILLSIHWVIFLSLDAVQREMDESFSALSPQA
jgi:hypothetical protein